MSPYWALLQARYRTLLQYRGAALAGASTQFWWGFIKVMILQAFYAANAAAPMPFDAAVTYVWLGQAFIALQPWSLDRDIVEMVRSGNVAYELMRPVDLYAYWYMRVLAHRAAGVSLRCVPIFACTGVVLSLSPVAPWALGLPASPQAAVAFAAALAVAFLLSAALTTLAHMALFWTLAGDGLNRLLPPAAMVFSGMVVPLPFFPEWVQPLVRALPFRALCDVPFRIYTGDLPIAAALPELALALAWTLALVAAGRAVLARGARRIVVQGG